jgi:RNA polymerase sigma-70 factor (ECF subfamily)
MTRWSRVLAAGGNSTESARQALEQLCEAYWRPLYGFLRYKGNSHHQAEDLVQGFFAYLLSREENWFGKVQRERGRFRTYLLNALGFYVRDQWKKTQSTTKEGKQLVFSIDAKEEEGQTWDLPDHRSPEQEYERRWALALLDRVFKRMEQEAIQKGKALQFQELCPHILKDAGNETYKDVALKLGMNENSVTQEVHRMKKRYGALLQAEIAETVGDPDEIQAELAHLLEVFGQ